VDRQGFEDGDQMRQIESESAGVKAGHVQEEVPFDEAETVHPA
jgi:hypothetical protein